MWGYETPLNVQHWLDLTEWLIVSAVQSAMLLKRVVGCHCYSVWVGLSPECDVIKKSMHSLCWGVTVSWCSPECEFVKKSAWMSLLIGAVQSVM